MNPEEKKTDSAVQNFIRDIVNDDVNSGRAETVVTRFPPEPNGYLHIGHAKSISLNFGLSEEFGGRCHLRFDDTNPVKEEAEYIEAIKKDVNWLGFNWGENLFFASDHFEKLYQWAVHLIKNGNAFIDDLSAEEIKKYRGTLTEPGKNSPYRDRPIEENLDIFKKMRAGSYPNGARVLRAKIDMASGNINMRDPILYRILHTPHPRTGKTWCIYPTYDFAHGQSDAIEGVTHSLCTLEFQDHQPLYQWFIKNLPVPFIPKQYEFARLNLTHTLLSKRGLIRLVKEGHVNGWDDPRMPTLSGMRRRGIPPLAIRNFIKRIGVSKADNLVDIAMLDHCIREVLNKSAPRRMGVINPLKVVIKNYPTGSIEYLEAVNNPEDLNFGTRTVPFSREIYIERDDFLEEPTRKFFRLSPGREVRLRYAYFITCIDVLKDGAGNITEIHATYDPETRGGNSPDGRKVKGTLHWVSAAHAVSSEIRLYDRLFLSESPKANEEFLHGLNPKSVTVISNCALEPEATKCPPGGVIQLERQGYFCLDPSSTDTHKIFNRTIGLRDTWAKIQRNQNKE